MSEQPNRSLPPSRAGEVMRAVHRHPGLTRAQLAVTVGLSTGMASDVVAALVKTEQLSEGDPAPGGGPGRPTRTLWPHPAGPLVAVAAISHENWQVEAIGLGGEPVTSLEARHDRTEARVLPRVARAFQRLWDLHGDRIQGFAVSVPGTVSGTRLVQAANLGWQDVELITLRPAAAAAIPLIASNDATYSGIAELTRGAAVGSASSLHLFMDSGVGGALIEGGRVVTGAHGMAGEFGHMPFGARRARCRCGARGCWNTELDGVALAHGLALPVPADEVSFSRSIMTAAQAGSPDELRVVGRAAGSLGRGIAGLVNATDPELVVLSGLAAEMLRAAPQRVQRTYGQGLMATIAARPPELVVGILGERGPLVGAMEAAFAPVLAHPEA